MDARQKAEELRQAAIQELLTERHAIDESLKLLGHGHEVKAPNAKRRGRPPKAGRVELPRREEFPTE